jgi:hypothetical protein
VKTPHESSKPPGLNLGNRDSTNRVLGTTPAPKGQYLHCHFDLATPGHSGLLLAPKAILIRFRGPEALLELHGFGNPEIGTRLRSGKFAYQIIRDTEKSIHSCASEGTGLTLQSPVHLRT